MRRIIPISIVGVAVAAAAFAVNRLSDTRSVRDLFLFIAITALLLTVGMVAAVGFSAWEDRRRWKSFNGGTANVTRSLWSTVPAEERCNSCHRRMTKVGELLLCPVCDRAPV